MSQSTLSTGLHTIVVMGVCGCGKTLIGQKLAAIFGGVFEDADDFHPESNKELMRAGIPLQDEQRWPWFEKLRTRIEEMRRKKGVYVLACSALKKVYREKLRAGDTEEELIFLHLKGTKELIFQRMSLREGHYMPASLLDSQMAILEEGPDVLEISIDGPPEAVLQRASQLVAML